MTYLNLAKELMESLQKMRNKAPQRNFSNVMGGELFILKYLNDERIQVLPGDISNKMNISSARVAAALNSLEKKEFVTRQIDPNDRRKILVAITDKGKEFSLSIEKNILNEVQETLENIGEEDANELVRIVKKMSDSRNK